MIFVKMTNGFGNNLFQYNAAKVLAEFHKTEVCAIPITTDYYGIEPLKSIGVNFCSQAEHDYSNLVNDNNYVSFFDSKYTGTDMLVSGYFEDYRYYVKMRDKIKSWFTKVDMRNDNDLVLHIRAGDRLFYKNEFDSKPRVENFTNAIDQFDFDRLHIVTDMPKWETITVDDISKMKFHVDVPKEQSVSSQAAVEYYNSLVEGLQKYQPIVEKRDVLEDFNFIRGFKNILFQHGTLSWWAAFLGNPSKVGVYGPWRPWKGQSNKNLGNTPIEGWFQWN